MIRHYETVESELSLRDQIESAAVRNATFIVLLRHVTYALHACASAGHPRSVPWTLCPNPDCRKVAVMLGDRRPAPPRVAA